MSDEAVLQRTSAPGGSARCTPWKHPRLGQPLSARELVVLRLISHGCTTREIASRIGIAMNTVKYHLKNVFDKLGATRRIQAVVLARRGGVLGPGDSATDLSIPRDMNLFASLPSAA